MCYFGNYYGSLGCEYGGLGYFSGYGGLGCGFGDGGSDYCCCRPCYYHKCRTYGFY
ncbi:keratin-associated protein 20-2-like [Ochotona curzoniae]|uniref:keratin-associated protein 20-2-like n=1 Tax=Ochotona curzoniae TaxID=130825 RepID=UPI001B345E00|nr:keratin-associated protein 20-2-like [Ochotona curzoniae]